MYEPGDFWLWLACNTVPYGVLALTIWWVDRRADRRRERERNERG